MKNICPVCGGRLIAERGWYYSEIYEVDKDGCYDIDKPIKKTIHRDLELDNGVATLYCENNDSHYCTDEYETIEN